MRASGTFTNSIQYLSNKALKVIFTIRRRFQTETNNAKLFLKLFDTCVKPILLYGSELWSVFNINICRNCTDASQFSLKNIMIISCLKKFIPGFRIYPWSE